mmetsp:Transcript_41401/g.81651  ORF Transcript_41401/g.81651 Transcript_41401/m.81651 type:complete len:550 (+) Transcript_41401:506-2155(+)
MGDILKEPHLEAQETKRDGVCLQCSVQPLLPPSRIVGRVIEMGVLLENPQDVSVEHLLNDPLAELCPVSGVGHGEECKEVTQRGGDILGTGGWTVPERSCASIHLCLQLWIFMTELKEQVVSGHVALQSLHTRVRVSREKLHDLRVHQLREHRQGHDRVEFEHLGEFWKGNFVCCICSCRTRGRRRGSSSSSSSDTLLSGSHARLHSLPSCLLKLLVLIQRHRGPPRGVLATPLINLLCQTQTHDRLLNAPLCSCPMVSVNHQRKEGSEGLFPDSLSDPIDVIGLCGKGVEGRGHVLDHAGFRVAIITDADTENGLLSLHEAHLERALFVEEATETGHDLRATNSSAVCLCPHANGQVGEDGGQVPEGEHGEDHGEGRAREGIQKTRRTAFRGLRVISRRGLVLVQGSTHIGRGEVETLTATEGKRRRRVRGDIKHTHEHVVTPVKEGPQRLVVVHVQSLTRNKSLPSPHIDSHTVSGSVRHTGLEGDSRLLVGHQSCLIDRHNRFLLGEGDLSGLGEDSEDIQRRRIELLSPRVDLLRSLCVHLRPVQ